MTIMYLVEDTRPVDFWLKEAADPGDGSREVDLSEEFITRYHEAVMDYDGVQAELELIYKSKEVD